MKRLTTAYLLDKEKIESIILKNWALVEQSVKPFFLVIYSRNTEFTKATIYPVDYELVSKVIIGGANIDQSVIAEIARILVDFEILHTSGIVAISDGFLYEMYIAGEFGTRSEIKEYYYKLRKIPGVESLEEEWIALS